MHRPTSVLAGLMALAIGTGLLLHGCQESPEPTGPDFAKIKKDRTLYVQGAGTGSGTVTAPAVGEVQLMCEIVEGQYAPEECMEVYGWKSTVTLTAAPQSTSTFAGWSGACTGTAPTCKVVLTQSRTVKATFTARGPTLFAVTVLGSGTGSGSVKTPTGVTPAIDCTITAGTPTGACSGSYVEGTSVQLTATWASEQTFDGWSGDCSAVNNAVCTVTMTSARTVTAALTAPAGTEATLGSWAPPSSSPIIGLHLSHLSNGKAIAWGHGGEPYVWNPAGGGFTMAPDNTCAGGNCELFCAGHTFLPDGRLLVAGGHDEELGDNNGLTQASIFDGTSWTATASMRYRRWYPTLVTLANGNVVALAGSQSPGVPATYPERYDGSSWTILTSASASLPTYPRAFVEPKLGRVFVAGDGAPRWLDASGTGAWEAAPSRRIGNRNYGAAVMLDGKVMYIGGGGAGCPSLPEASAEVIDLAAAGEPSWSAVAPMKFRRRHLNATILPDGKVLVTGGTSSCGFTTESGTVYAAELYDPAADSWTTVANANVMRVYHSSAMLLADGRVLTTGSGDGGGVTQQLNYEVFSPPYLFKGARPAYDLRSSTMRYGQPFVISTPNAASIVKVTLLRLVSTTHAFDMGQRLNTLAFTTAGDGQSLTATAPASGLIAPPGPYMLFIVNDRGVPSVAQTILVSP